MKIKRFLAGFALLVPAARIVMRLGQRLRYWRILRRIRAYSPDRKIKVVFVVYCTSKWKTQSLYDLMAESDCFDPLVVLTLDKRLCEKDVMSAVRQMISDRQFYESQGCRCVYGTNPDNGALIPLREFHADITFFQDPGAATLPNHQLIDACGYSLCCYVPYAIETFQFQSIHSEPWFHARMFLQFAPSEKDAAYIRHSFPWYMRSSKIVGTGHTVFDDYLKDAATSIESSTARTVIYAPHFSIPKLGSRRPIEIATFQWNGEAILAYAKKHPEINWIFKPHPVLRYVLANDCGWSESRIEKYYSDWGMLGKTYCEGDYIKLFRSSDAMITDCSSFLVEYPLTGKPLIRLNLRETNVYTRPSYVELFESFYNVDDLDSMHIIFDKVLIQGEDPKRDDRLKAVAALGLGRTSSAERIYDYLRSVCQK